MQLARCVSKGGIHVPMVLQVDARSVYAAITATFIGSIARLEGLAVRRDLNDLHVIVRQKNHPPDTWEAAAVEAREYVGVHEENLDPKFNCWVKAEIANLEHRADLSGRTCRIL